MDTNFLNALKAKADKIQSDIKKPSIQDLKTNNSTDFWNSAVKSYNPERETACTVIDHNFGTVNQTILDDAIVTHVERVVNKNRIDVYFDKKPSEKIRSGLKDNGFRFNPDTKAWYHKDCLQACNYLTACLNVQGLSTIDKFKNESTEPETVKSLPISENLASDFENEAYQQYKKQVNQLIDALKCDIADLPMIAIDCLYRQTFN